MTTYSNNAAGGTNGTAVTVANSGGTSGTPFGQVNKVGTGSVTFTNSHTVGVSPLSYAVQAPSATDVAQLITPSYATVADGAARISFWFNTLPSATCDFVTVRNTSSVMCKAQILGTGKLRLTNVSSGTLHDFTTTLTTGGWYTLDMQASARTTAGASRVQAALYVGDVAAGTSPTETYDSGFAADLGTTGAIDHYRFGKITATGVTMDVLLGRLAWSTFSPTLLGIPVNDQPPVANAGADQASVEPWATVTLDGSASTDPDGTVTAWAWRQISGTTVTLTGTGATRTFQAPASMAGDYLVFGLTVTDDLAVTSAEDTTIVQVLPATEFLATATGWQPIRTVIL